MEQRQAAEPAEIWQRARRQQKICAAHAKLRISRDSSARESARDIPRRPRRCAARRLRRRVARRRRARGAESGRSVGRSAAHCSRAVRGTSLLSSPLPGLSVFRALQVDDKANGGCRIGMPDRQSAPARPRRPLDPRSPPFRPPLPPPSPARRRDGGGGVICAVDAHARARVLAREDARAGRGFGAGRAADGLAVVGIELRRPRHGCVASIPR